jgi:hypothetical protein
MHLNAYTLNECQVNLATNRDGSGPWVPARPCLQPFSMRLADAWDVLTGRAESVIFPGQEAR